MKIEQEIPPLYSGHRAVLVCGENYMGFNRLMKPALEE
jgi:hypothetical protein